MQVKVYEESGDTPIAESAVLTTAVEGDLTAVLTVTGLDASTAYRYELYMDGNKIDVASPVTFTTFPPAALPASFSIA